MSHQCLDIASLFAAQSGRTGETSGRFDRMSCIIGDKIELILDYFSGTAACCSFLRFSPDTTSTIDLIVDGGYSIETTPAGGWVLSPADATFDSFWVPQPPMIRRLDAQGHILSLIKAEPAGIEVSTARLAISLHVAQGKSLDVAIWRLPAVEGDLTQALHRLSALEYQRFFLWSSHTAYERPADLYLHLIHGHLYENHEVWPRYWRVCSELDAYALYLVLSGLERATGKRLYSLLKCQVVFSVIARQAEDGGWYHGEWTDQMESHYRLHTGGTLMLADYLEETGAPLVRDALEKAVAFSVRATDHLEKGVWFLHDSLEQNADSAGKYPFHWVRSRAFGKSPTNMLILNTHLDTTVAVERYMRVTGDRKHAGLVSSAQNLTHEILAQRPAEWLYRPIFRAINMTVLPKAAAQALPLPKRALKRIAWKYLIPLLPHIKARFPRVVMPGGFIDRALAQSGMSYRYQPVNLMDLIRTRRIFGEARLDTLLDTSFWFTQHSGIRMRWKELKGKEDDSLGFWCESLYHLCLARDELRYRTWLAGAMIDLSDNALGLSPSLLGANREAIATDQQLPCPTPIDGRLQIANLSQRGGMELLVVNPSHSDIPLAWQIPPCMGLEWTDTSSPAESGVVPARGWLRGKLAPQPSASEITRCSTIARSEPIAC